MKKDKKKPIKIRNLNAVKAHFRNGGPMKDRRSPRGGAKNKQRDLLEEEPYKKWEPLIEAFSYVVLIMGPFFMLAILIVFMKNCG